MAILNDYIGVLESNKLRKGSNAGNATGNKLIQNSNSDKVASSSFNRSSLNAYEKKTDAAVLASALKAYNLAKPAVQVSFGRALEDHLSYGANYLDNGKTNFKVMAPKAQSMFLEVVKKEDISPDKDLRQGSDKEFYWNYEADPTVKSRTIEMPQVKKGIFEVVVDDVNPGDVYRFVINGKEVDGKIQGIKRKDPSSKSVFDAVGWSEVVNDIKLRSNITHNWAKDNELLIISEEHAGLTGGFEKTKERIDRIVQQGNANAVEIMPIAEFYGSKNWGYDGVDWSAAESSYGGVEKFKELVDYAHNKGLKVILDVVPNHLGPFGNVLNDFGAAFDPGKPGTPWGESINYEAEGNEYMRRAVVDMALHWLNLGVDGLRLDMTKFMYSDITRKQVNSEVKNHFPNAIIIDENGDNTKKTVNKLTPEEIANPEESFYKDLYRLGSDAQWNFDFQHTLEALITGRTVMDTFGPNICDLEDEFKQGFKSYQNPYDKFDPPPADTNLVYHMSHDESGNHGGKRTIHKAMVSKLDIYNRMVGKDGKKGDIAFFELLKAHLSNADDKNWSEVQKKHGITRPVSKQEFSAAYNQAQALNRLALGTVFVNPSRRKMILMGDDEGALAPLKFFAEYPAGSKDENGVLISKKVSDEKGYQVGEESFNESKLDQNAYADPKLKEEVSRYSKALKKVVEENPALNNGKANWGNIKTYHYKDPKVLHILRKEGNNEMLAVMNFGDRNFGDGDEAKFTVRSLELPVGHWKEVLNSNAKEFGGSGFTNNNAVLTTKAGMLDINLSKHSIAIFKKEA
ncbi:MAG: Malto-oligosyltrehalose trehalohydrolase [uncultured bacterium]|nr:MAG: Malto-oligosyltrehalose trehalohydrolase [uncultured bacterium]HBH18372.1 hypothetical protein [Cyanobacteria bacterium UBA9579]